MVNILSMGIVLKRVWLCFLFFSPYLLFGQNVVEEGSYKFVVAPDGLRARTAPSLSGEVITVFSYGTLIPFSQRTLQSETISGASGYWYGFLSSVYHRELWVFGGYLADWFEPEPYLGEWYEEATQLDWSIKHYRDFASGASAMGGTGIFGRGRQGKTFAIRGNRIFFVFDDHDLLSDAARRYHQQEAEIVFTEIDNFTGRNRMILRFDTEDVLLTRMNNW